MLNLAAAAADNMWHWGRCEFDARGGRLKLIRLLLSHHLPIERRLEGEKRKIVNEMKM